MGGGGEMNFIYFEKVANVTYPIGGEFNDNFDYIREAARTLHTVVDKDKDIALVCRGTSGCIIAGAVGYILKKKGRKVTIVISRKSKNTHGDNMDRYYKILKGAVPVVIDDFISSGDTIGEILKDLDDFIKWDTYPFLCTANFLDESVLIGRKENGRIMFYEVINRFDTMICNKPKYDVH